MTAVSSTYAVTALESALFNVTVKVIELPSTADASSIVNAGLSSSRIVPVAESRLFTGTFVPETLRLT
ncbi:MAG: hypothetical protein F4X11_02725 [Acidobacteria bacterium]|nr:hypothetical protein [Acidobacteriota bacterium]